MNPRMILLLVGVLLACSAGAVRFDAARPVWTTAEKDEVNASVAFTTHFAWDGKAPLQLRLAGCSVFKVFVEWSHANDPKLVKEGVNWPSNMTYADVLAKAARLYGRPELAEQAKKLKSLIRERAYDGVWFRDNAKRPDVTETCQYYAFFHGIATPKTHPGLWKKLTEEFGPERQARGLYKEVWPSNAFIGNLMRLVVLKRAGFDAQVAREIRGYYLKMAEMTGTLWEHDRPEASCNHAFASFLAILLERSAAGK